MTKPILIFLFLISLTTFVSARSEKNYKHTVSLNPLSCFIKTISVSYAYKLDDKWELTINPMIHFHSPKDNNVLLGLYLDEDPFWYYDAFTVRSGFRRYFNKKTYIEPILFCKYAFFDNRKLKIEDHEGDMSDRSYILDRNYHSGGIILKSGLMTGKNRFRFHFFYGLGYYIRYYNEVIYEEMLWHHVIPDTYPVRSNYWKHNVSIHVGIELGFRF